MAPSVLVVCAMESEALHLRQRLADVEDVPTPAAAWRMSRGSLHSAEVSVLVCGVGEANAAGATAAVLAGGWRPRAVLNYGCAGAHEVAVREGDVVRLFPPSSPRPLPCLQRRWRWHRWHCALQRGLRPLLTSVPQILGAQVLPMDAAKHNPDDTNTISGFRGDNTAGSSWDFGDSEANDKYTLKSDAALLLAARSAADKLSAANALPFWPGRDGPPVVHVGVIGSSDTWTQHRATIEALHSVHNTLCEEMECQAIATICRTYGVPFLGKLTLR